MQYLWSEISLWSSEKMYFFFNFYQFETLIFRILKNQHLTYSGVTMAKIVAYFIE